jgi:hypothetical protein
MSDQRWDKMDISPAMVPEGELSESFFRISPSHASTSTAQPQSSMRKPGALENYEGRTRSGAVYRRMEPIPESWDVTLAYTPQMAQPTSPQTTTGGVSMLPQSYDKIRPQRWEPERLRMSVDVRN